MKQNEIERLLPDVFQRAALPGSPLRAFLAAMEELHAPCEELLADLGRVLDPRVAPPPLVPFLARWVDLGWLLARSAGPREVGPDLVTSSSGLGWLRELVAAAPRLAGLSGTAPGLVAFLEVATGRTGFAVDEEVRGEPADHEGGGGGEERGAPRPFHVRVRAPAAARPQETLIHRIIQFEIPAHLTYELEFESEAEAEESA